MAADDDENETSQPTPKGSPVRSPPKRMREQTSTPQSPLKKSRNVGESREDENMDDHERAQPTSHFLQSMHSRLIEQLGDSAMAEFLRLNVKDVVKANNNLPYCLRDEIAFLRLDGGVVATTRHWKRIVFESREAVSDTLEPVLRAQRAALGVLALALLHLDFKKLLYIHANFVRIFDTHELFHSAWQLDLRHDLQIQLCLTHLESQPERKRDEIVELYFPTDAEAVLRVGTSHKRILTSLESQYVNRCDQTRETLVSYQSLKSLRRRHQWQPLLQKLIEHTRIEITHTSPNIEDLNATLLQLMEQEHDRVFSQSHSTNTEDTEGFTEDDLLTQAALAAHASHQTSGLRVSTSEQLAKGRMVASSKPSQRPRDPKASQGHRRPWSYEEEEALLKGLDIVSGPYWSQILSLFGESGTVSNVLKDRNQVQLKDKARNLKLFFLKNDQPVPRSLAKVTGDLKTRAPMYLVSLEDTPDEVHADQPSPSSKEAQQEDDTARMAETREPSAPVALDSGLPEHVADGPDRPDGQDHLHQNHDLSDSHMEDLDDSMDAAILQAVAAIQEAEQNKIHALHLRSRL